MQFQLYPDEIVYSACSRIHAITGANSLRQTFRRFFGKPTNHFMWPTRLENFASYLEVSPSILLNKHTTYPYYKWILQTKKIKSLENTILNGNGNPVYNAPIG